eukprot:CAMPEP_0194284204 /NCGR_PEP_ID=MMETSP0169-20130528/27002_1 /TAXON_ID=218684 /ORGANISM="Corethron pennatum, Strain L29A3" /LENGTH=334 /DNA_ID=CAMNT_0039029957 /DNA_START=27 /DNA_END=1031 /DNA_ORIENTATION=-
MSATKTALTSALRQRYFRPLSILSTGTEPLGLRWSSIPATAAFGGCYRRQFVTGRRSISFVVADRTAIATLPVRHLSTVGMPIVPPVDFNSDIIDGVYSSLDLILRHGLGKSRLASVREMEGGIDNIVQRWQNMMEIFLGAQVHVVVSLGYSPDEAGLTSYKRDLAEFLQSASPVVQESHRTRERDLWRYVVLTAFGAEDVETTELSIIEARDIMFRVSSTIGESRVLEAVAKRAASGGESTTAGGDTADLQRKHTAVQESLVKDVYFHGDPSLLSSLGFEGGEEGYVRLQCALAEHQMDPLIQQYMGVAMQRLLSAAGVDIPGMMNAAAAKTP